MLTLMFASLLAVAHLTPANLTVLVADTRARLHPGPGRHRRSTPRPRHAARRETRR
jgi:hypothetical protein